MTTFRHLQIFVAVAECGTMRKAAETLYISQPSVSQAIQELEEQYHTRLFDRLSKRIYITEAGKILLDYAKQIIHSIETMEETMKKVSITPILRIGASVTVGTVYINQLITLLENRIPGVDIRIVVDNTSNIEELVSNNELDFAIIEGILTKDELMSQVICKDELVMVVGKTHPFYSRKIVQLEDLQGMNLIARESGSTGRNQFENYLIEHNIHMVKKWRSTNTEAIKKAVEQGLGIAILSKKLVEKEIQEGTLKPLHIKQGKIIRDIHLILHKDKEVSETIQEVLETFKRQETFHENESL